jgi:hypothetical protein
MAGVTNKGKYREADAYYRNQNVPTNFYIALVKLSNNHHTIDNAAAVDKGGGEVGIPITGHSLAAGDHIEINGTTNYDGQYYINSQTANEIVITATYNAETFGGTETVDEIPGTDTNTFSELSEIAAGNGYTSGGYQLSRDTTDFDSLTEDDTDDQAELLIKDVAWTASGGNIPDSGDGARFAVMLDDNGTVASRHVLGWWDLTSERSVVSGGVLTLQDMEIDLTE